MFAHRVKDPYLVKRTVDLIDYHKTENETYLRHESPRCAVRPEGAVECVHSRGRRPTRLAACALTLRMLG